MTNSGYDEDERAVGSAQAADAEYGESQHHSTESRQPPSDEWLLLTTNESIAGYETTRTLGLVRGNDVRAKNVGSDFVAGLKNLTGGELRSYGRLLSDARETALWRMNNAARQMDADAVVGVRLETSEIAQSAAEIVAYGTAVEVVQK